MHVNICSFSTKAAELKPKDRTAINALLALQENPRISTFDMSDNAWLCGLVKLLESKNYIKPVNEPYPWHKWKITKTGLERINKAIIKANEANITNPLSQSK